MRARPLSSPLIIMPIVALLIAFMSGGKDVRTLVGLE